MAGPAPNTKNWTARENVHRPKGLHVIVSGLVETSDTKHPVLIQGSTRKLKTLDLELTLEDSGQPAIVVKKPGKPGTEVLVWKEALFHTEVTANQYNDVDVRWAFHVIANVPVVDDREQQQHMAKLMQAVNAAHPAKKVAPKKPAKKKVPAKKAAPKKSKSAKTAKPKAVGGWAKGAKTAKKSVKKAAKKAAKKSTLKRFVRKLVKKLTPAKKGKKKR